MTRPFHFVARMRSPHALFNNAEACAYLWSKLRARFPNALACVLMPNHLHIFVPAANADEIRWLLATELRAWSRKFHPGLRVWQEIPEAELVEGDLHIKRMIRYIHLNPCRAELTNDPLEWEWSTHRDVTGCTSDPWPNLETLTQLFRCSRSRLGEVMHDYISADPSVAVIGTPPVRIPVIGQPIVADTLQVFRAVCAAQRLNPILKRGATRSNTIQLAERLKLTRDPEALGISRFTWYRGSLNQSDPAVLQAALRILGDRRLLAPMQKQIVAQVQKHRAR